MTSNTHYQRGWSEGHNEAILFHHVNPVNYARRVQESVANGEIHPRHAVGKLDAWEKQRLLTPEQYIKHKAQVNDLTKHRQTHGYTYRHLHKGVTDHEQHRPEFNEIRKNISRTHNAAYTKRQRELQSFPTPYLPSMSSLEYTPRVQKNERSAYQRGLNEGHREAILFHHVNPANYARRVRESVARGEIHPQHAAGKLDAWEKQRLLTPEQYKKHKAQVNDLNKHRQTHGYTYRHLHKGVTDHEQHRPEFNEIRGTFPSAHNIMRI